MIRLVDHCSSRTLLLLLAVPIILSCGLKETTADLVALQAALHHEYGVKGPDLELVNGHIVAVTFVNSPFDRLDSDQRAQQALHVGRFLKAQLATLSTLSGCDSLSVSFTTRRTRFLIIRTSTTETRGFRMQELPALPEDEARVERPRPSMILVSRIRGESSASTFPGRVRCPLISALQHSSPSA